RSRRIAILLGRSLIRSFFALKSKRKGGVVYEIIKRFQTMRLGYLLLGCAPQRTVWHALWSFRSLIYAGSLSTWPCKNRLSVSTLTDLHLNRAPVGICANKVMCPVRSVD